MQRQLEQIIVAATLAFLLGCHAGLSKLLPLIPALILAGFFSFAACLGLPPKGWSKVVGRGRYWFVFLLWRCQRQRGHASAAAAFADFYRSGSTAFRQSGSWQCQSNAAGNQSGACLSYAAASGADKQCGTWQMSPDPIQQSQYRVKYVCSSKGRILARK